MPEKAAREVGADPVAMAALNELLEASLELSGPKKAGAYLRVLAARVATPTDAGDVIPIRPRVNALDVSNARSWLRERLPHWLSKYG